MKDRLPMTALKVVHEVDYIAFSTTHFEVPDEVFGKPQATYPRQRNYKEAYEYECGLIVQFDKLQPRMKQSVIATGDTLKKIRDYGFSDKELLTHFLSLHRARFSRIDLAITAYGYTVFTPNYAWHLVVDGMMQSRLQADKPVVDISKNVETLYVGSRKKRNRLLRVYNKSLELGDTAQQIVRIELESRKAAQTVANEVKNENNFAGIIRRVVDFQDSAWHEIMDCEPLPRLRNASDVNAKQVEIDKKMQWLLSSVSPAIAQIAANIGWNHEFWDTFTATTKFKYDKLLQNNESDV